VPVKNGREKRTVVTIGGKSTEAILDTVIDLPYAKTSRYMAKLADIEVSPQKITGIVSVEGAKLLSEDERQRVAAFDKTVMILHLY